MNVLGLISQLIIIKTLRLTKSSLKQHIFNPFPNILSLKINMIMYSLGASNMKTDSKIKTYAKKKSAMPYENQWLEWLANGGQT